MMAPPKPLKCPESGQWRNDRPCRPHTAGGAVLGGRQNSTLAMADGQKIIGVI